MAQRYKGAISLHELCNYLYVGFGQWAVYNLVADRQREGYLSDVEWRDCLGSCLVCGGN